MARATNNHSGYPMKWFKDQNFARNSYECAICLEILKDPVQVRDCGHQFCGLCIDDILKTDPRCPSCRIDISHAMIFKDHAANRLIRKLDVNCSNEGCSWIGSLSSLLEDHVNSCSFLVPIGNNNVEELDKKLEEQFKTLMSEISTLKKKHEDDIKEIKTKYEYDIKEIKTKHEVDSKEIQTKAGCSYNASSTHEKDIKEIKTKHEDGMKEIKNKHEDDIKKIKSKHEGDIYEIKFKHQKDIQDLRQEISWLRQLTNCAGTCTLKIYNFSRTLSRAQRNHADGTINSDTFYHSDGYKMKFGVNLSEASMGYTGYMGVYLHLMKSDHDEMLRWPFTKSCTFSVIDQQDNERQRKDYVDTLVPKGEDEFQRPRQDENKGRGFAQFVSHSTLRTRRYIKDDVVYVKVVVQP